MKKKLIICILLILLLLLTIPLSIIGYAYLNVELKTSLYSSQFYQAAYKSFWQGEVSYIKVFDYSPVSTKLYIIEWVNAESTSDLESFRISRYYFLTRKNIHQKWEFDHKELLWSERGSADEWSFPPYF